MGRVLVDRAILGIMGPGKMKFTIHGRQELLGLVKKGRGFIMLMSHVGCWQVAVSALNFLKVPVNLLLEQEEGNIDRHYFEYAGVTCPIRIIDPGSFLGGTLQMLDVLKKGEVVCMMGDRVFGSEKSCLEIDFFGEKASFPYSAFKIGSATGAPIVVFFSYKTGYDSYALKVSKIIEVPENIGRSGESFRPYVTQYVNELELYTREYPYQFFNFYNMWQ
jgi:predicted LPLAT superfamily acyltransferase